MSLNTKILAGTPIGDLPLGTHFTYEGKGNLSVQPDSRFDCEECGFYELHSESNCQLLELGIKTFCGKTERADGNPVYYRKEADNDV